MIFRRFYGRRTVTRPSIVLVILPKASMETHRGIPLIGLSLIPWRGEDSRHACCCEASDGLFGLGSSALGGGLEARS